MLAEPSLPCYAIGVPFAQPLFLPLCCRLGIVAEVKLFGDFYFKLGAFCFAEMESSHSNTPNASNPQTQTDTPETQSPTQTQNPTSEGLMVGDRRKAPKSIVWLHCTKQIKKDGNGVEKVIGVVKFIIKDEHPFRVVEGSGFKEMMNEVQPRFKVPSRKKVAEGVWELFMVEKAKIMSVIVFTITVDNASANDGAVEYMAQSLKAMNTLILDGKYLHLRCACHILNLIVKDGLKELSASIEGIRNCVKFIHSSSARLDKFREFAIACRMDKMENVPMDVPTRWNATYKMLEGAFKYKQIF
ncbi:unnamed protein product [Prunus brigantina]